jgi:hypothetical protein
VYSDNTGFLSENAGAFFVANNKSYKQPAPENGIMDKFGYGSGVLIGIDLNQNRYFRVAEARIIICDNNAVIIKVLDLDSIVQRYKSTSKPTVSMDGDIYLICSAESSHEVILLDKKW